MDTNKVLVTVDVYVKRTRDTLIGSLELPITPRKGEHIVFKDILEGCGITGVKARSLMHETYYTYAVVTNVLIGKNSVAIEAKID